MAVARELNPIVVELGRDGEVPAHGTLVKFDELGNEAAWYTRVAKRFAVKSEQVP